MNHPLISFKISFFLGGDFFRLTCIMLEEFKAPMIMRDGDLVFGIVTLADVPRSDLAQLM